MLVAFWQSQRLTREINALEKEAMDLQIKLSNYQRYAGMLGGSSIINLGNLAGMPSELLPRATIFAQYSDQASSMSAMQNLQMLKMTGRIPFLNNPIMQQQYEWSAFNQLKQQSLKELKQQEANMLNEYEKEIQLRLNSVEQQLAMKRKQKDTYKEKAKQDAQNSAPDFG